MPPISISGWKIAGCALVDVGATMRVESRIGSLWIPVFVTCQGAGRLVQRQGVAVGGWRLRVGATARHLSGRRIG
jgi:hypothetical protein